MPRQWFKIHLSTCVVLMLSAGALLWINVARRQFFFHGFPCVAVSDNQFDGEVSETYCELYDSGLPQWRYSFSSGLTVMPLALAANIFIALVALSLVAVACEAFLPRIFAFLLPRVRFSLATLLLGTVCSGALFLLNLREIRYLEWGAFDADIYTHHGWPYDAFVTYDYDQLAVEVDARISYGIECDRADGCAFYNIVTPFGSIVVCPVEAAVDICVALFLIGGFGGACEIFARGREHNRVTLSGDTASQARPAPPPSGC